MAHQTEIVVNGVVTEVTEFDHTAQEIDDSVDRAMLSLLAVAAAAAYDPEGSYAVGDYCTYRGKLRKCSSAIPSGETWTESHWTTTTVAAEMEELSSQLSNRLRLPIAIPANADLNNYITPGMYYCDVDATVESVQNCPTTHAFSLFVEIGAASEVVQTLKTWHDGNGYKTTVYVRSKYPEWGAGWQKLATATPPEGYNLPLSDGISVQDGLSAVYNKNQFGEVVVHGDLVGQMQNGSVIATLPAGFRPIYTLEMPATCDFTAGRIQVNSAGEIIVISQLSECSSLCFLAVFVAGG